MQNYVHQSEISNERQNNRIHDAEYELRPGKTEEGNHFNKCCDAEDHVTPIQAFVLLTFLLSVLRPYF